MKLNCCFNLVFLSLSISPSAPFCLSVPSLICIFLRLSLFCTSHVHLFRSLWLFSYSSPGLPLSQSLCLPLFCLSFFFSLSLSPGVFFLRSRLSQCACLSVYLFAPLSIFFFLSISIFFLFLATTGDVWIIPSFNLGLYVLHVEYISCVITDCGNHSESSRLPSQ